MPVCSSNIEFKASFEIPGTPTDLPQGAELHWSRAEFITGATDSRGALADITLKSGGQTEAMALSKLVDAIPISQNARHTAETELKIFGLQTGPNVKPGSKFEIGADMKFSGAQRISILPYGKTSTLTMVGNWPHPGFDRGFLPVKRSVSNNGFRAEWSIPFIARGVGGEGRTDVIANLASIAPSVSFVELADAYQSVARSL